MWWLLAILLVVNVIQVIVISRQDSRTATLSAENGLLKSRLAEFEQTGIRPWDRLDQWRDYNKSLNVESAMDAVRYNGFSPDYDGAWITFETPGGRFFLDVSKAPVAHFVYPFSLGDDIDRACLTEACDRLHERVIMGRASVGEDGNELVFFVDGIERNYGHLRDSLQDYIYLLTETRSRHWELYQEIRARRRDEQLALLPGPKAPLTS